MKLQIKLEIDLDDGIYNPENLLIEKISEKLNDKNINKIGIHEVTRDNIHGDSSRIEFVDIKIDPIKNILRGFLKDLQCDYWCKYKKYLILPEIRYELYEGCSGHRIIKEMNFINLDNDIKNELQIYINENFK